MRRALRFACLPFALLLLSLLPAHAQPLRANIEYRVIKQQPVSVTDGIEVIDFFWYGCPYCNKLQPALEKWMRGKPADVTVRHVPVVLKPNWAPHARIYYTLEALGEVGRLHQEVYRGYHIEELYMSRPEVMSQWAVRHKIDQAAWEAAYHSAEVTAKVERAVELTRQYGITGTPLLVVQGRYLTSGNMSESLEGLMPILDGLIRLARERAAAR